MKRHLRLIETIDDLRTNLNQIEMYLNDVDDIAAIEIRNLIGRGLNFVAYEIENSNELHFAPSRFIGYSNNSLKIHMENKDYIDGKDTSPRITKLLNVDRKYNDYLENEYINFCSKIGAKPLNMKSRQRKYWRLNDLTIELFECGVKQVTSNRYERNPDARKRCIEKYGIRCHVCDMNFQEVYGEIGKGFIHVHHIIPLSSRKKQHSVEGANLIPVCPNCHAMLHRGNITLEELRKIVKVNDKKKSPNL